MADDAEPKEAPAEEPKAEEAKEEPAATEEPKAEEAKEEPAATEEPKAEEPNEEAAAGEEPKAEEPETEATEEPKEEAEPAVEKKKINLKTGDGKMFEVDEPVAMEFEIVRSFFDENDDASPDMVVPLPNVAADPFEKVIDYCKGRVSLRGKGATKQEIKAFNAEFEKDKSNEQLKEMILVANYLNVKDCLDYLTETVANRIKNKSVEYVRKFFGIENDFTPEEEEKIRKEYEWAFEGVDPDD